MFVISHIAHGASVGDGIAREVFHTAFHRHIENNHSAYFLPRDNNTSTLRTLYPRSMAGLVPEDRIMNLRVLGALCALLMLHGQPPGHFGPGVFLYIISSFDLNAITSNFLGDWYPDVRHLILDWQDIGPGGSISAPHFRQYFATYHDIQVGYSISHIRCQN